LGGDIVPLRGKEAGRRAFRLKAKVALSARPRTVAML